MAGSKGIQFGGDPGLQALQRAHLKLLFLQFIR